MVFGFAFVAKTEQNLLLRLIFVIAGAPLCLYLFSPPFARRRRRRRRHSVAKRRNLNPYLRRRAAVAVGARDNEVEENYWQPADT
jgi:hypothetical protein